MQLYILGDSSDDTGTQLEKLTCTMLDNLGFKNIIKNEIGSGGHEIDVRAEYILPGLNGNNSKPIICECKAYKSAVTMTDWLKFLGKVLLEETKGSVDGYFIALSGVNGNVQGNYRDLRTHNRKNITLITGDELIKQLSDIFQIVTIKNIQQRIVQYTQRKPIEISLCYYNMCVYYLIGFSENEFTLFSNTGELIKVQESIQVSHLINKTSSYRDFIDLEDENIALNRFMTIKKFIISFILLHKKELSFNEIQEYFIEYVIQVPDIKANEIRKALDVLIEDSFIDTDVKKSMYNLKILSYHKQIDDVVLFYKYLVENIIPLFILGSESYNRYINEELLAQICKIQGGISIPKEYEEDCLKILKWSPSALLWSLKPDQMIVNHHSGGKSIYETLDKEDTSYFLQKLINLLSYDFKNKYLKDYFFKTCEIVELESNYRLKIKTKTKLELDMEYKERIGLAQMTEEYNNQIIHVRIFNEQPEPWGKNITNE